MKVLYVFVAVVFLSLIADPSTAEIYIPTQEAANAIANCESPQVSRVIYDPLSGYYIFDGENAEDLRKCLINKHGWKELGPPEYKTGTMQPSQ